MTKGAIHVVLEPDGWYSAFVAMGKHLLFNRGPTAKIAIARAMGKTR